ncbi:hypothetical protein RJ641_008912, partial [Dillenia turbinata]
TSILQQHDPLHLHEYHKRMGNPTVQKGLDAIASSLNYISGKISNALEIQLQLETLLAEKAGIARENSVHARENRFLWEVVEYHQHTMQDVVYLDEGIEEVTEVSRVMAKPEPIATTAPFHGAAS